MTLRNEYKQKTPMLREAEERAVPIYVLKSNTDPADAVEPDLDLLARDRSPRGRDARDRGRDRIGAVVVGGRSSCRRRTPTSGGSSTRWRSGPTSSRGRAGASRTGGSGSIRTPPAAAGGDRAARPRDFIGHSAVVIDLDGVRILTDPVTRARVGPLRRVEPVPARDRLRDIDAVLISHLHWDHLDVPSLRDLGRDVPMFVPAGSGPWMRAPASVTCARSRSASRSTVGGVVVRAVPAVHSGLPAAARADGAAARVRGPRQPARSTSPVTRTCSTGWASSANRSTWRCSRSGAGDRRSVAACTSTRSGRPEALRLIRPRAAVPIHWGTYWPHALGRVFPERLVEPPAAFVRVRRRAGARRPDGPDRGRRHGGVGPVSDDLTRPFDPGRRVGRGRPSSPAPASRRRRCRRAPAAPDLRRGLARLSQGLVAYGIIGLVVAVLGLGLLVYANSRLDAAGDRVGGPSAPLATTLDRTADALHDAATTAETFGHDARSDRGGRVGRRRPRSSASGPTSRRSRASCAPSTSWACRRSARRPMPSVASPTRSRGSTRA